MLIAFISDIHEDSKKLNKALSKINSLGCNFIVCLGDIIGFSVPFYKHISERNASECIELVTQSCKYVIAGNHEHFAIRKLPIHNPYPDLPENWYDLCYPQRKKINNNRIWLYEESELSSLICHKHIQWIYQLPEFQVIEFQNIRIFISHFIYPDLTGLTTQHLKLLSNYRLHYQFVLQHQAQLCFFGHIHSHNLLIFHADGSYTSGRKVKLNSTISGIGIPAIVRNSFSGFVTFDSVSFIIQIHKL